MRSVVPRAGGARPRRAIALVSGLGDGRRIYAVHRRVDDPLVSHRDLLAGMGQLLSGGIGAVPRTMLWDNESGIGQRDRLADGAAGFCGVLGTRQVQARPYDRETKGLVERANGNLGTSILPGRTSSSPADFDTQLTDWLGLSSVSALVTLRQLGHRHPHRLVPGNLPLVGHARRGGVRPDPANCWSHQWCDIERCRRRLPARDRPAVGPLRRGRWRQKPSYCHRSPGSRSDWAGRS